MNSPSPTSRAPPRSERTRSLPPVASSAMAKASPTRVTPSALPTTRSLPPRLASSRKNASPTTLAPTDRASSVSSPPVAESFMKVASPKATISPRAWIVSLPPRLRPDMLAASPTTVSCDPLDGPRA